MWGTFDVNERQMFRRAIVSLVALALFIFLTPAAFAHGTHRTNDVHSVIGFVGHHDGARADSSDPHLVATAYVQFVKSMSIHAAEPCPHAPGEGQANHSGCCGGTPTCTICCASCGAAAASSDEPLRFLPPRAGVPFTMAVLSDGIHINPTDPPPRTIA
jgi:hypothetical protein